MAALTIQLSDDKYEQLKKLTQVLGISLDQLMEELSTIALKEFDTRNRFKAMAAIGNKQKGLNLLEKLDALQISKPTLGN
ncbi:hypothetical protein [Adonisia turfae]|uniref:CopG family transcriptional regulator n=1 Tax=Adonisia turfae CCMR0081 TaxID=2292702 RepID=A0A6M0RW11_9CYAN|nr:hypothetical protein [Adonisia turfae]NEZ60003.1 hypothetical protein [Adonisia turfae CCMR0081]